jgi:hypothetical protein
MGRTARFDQIYVASLDADPIEQDVLTGVRSIITGELEADKVVSTIVGVANTNPTKSFTVGNKFFIDKDDPYTLRVTDDTELNRLFLQRLSLGTTQSTTALQVGDIIFGDTSENARTVLRVVGNTQSSNLIATNLIKTDNNDLIIDSNGSNTLSVSGNTYSTNVQVGKYLFVGSESGEGNSNVALFKNGNVIVENGFLKIYGDMNVYGNIAITESATYTSVENLVVSNAVIQMGTGNDGSFDTGILMIDNPSMSNIIAGYIHNQNEFVLGRTFGSPETQEFGVDTSNTMNLHVYGNVFTSQNIGAANTAPKYNLSVGSNLWVDDKAAGTQANVLWSNGYSYLHGLRLGPGGLAIGTAVTVNPQGVINPDASVISISGNIQAKGIRSTGEGNFKSGISNIAPNDTFSIGDKLFVNIYESNVLTVLGTTSTQRIISQSLEVTDFIEVEGDTGIKSVSSITVHADNDGPDSASNILEMKSGPFTANVSSIEVYGAKTSNTHQNIRFKTKNTERVRIASDGKVGIGVTEPPEKLTLGGNLKINGSNTAVLGNTWGTQGNTSMRVYSSPATGENFIENITAANKGLNIKVGQGPIPTTRMSIIENGRVGVGTTQPQARFQTSGGEVFINSNVSRDGGFTHLSGVPLTVTNTTPITTTNNPTQVLRLAREGKITTPENHGVRSTFKLAKFEESASTARTRLDIDLAHGSYAEADVNIMTLRSDGRVGVGTHTPESKLTVNVSGARNPNNNGILVTNLTDADVDQDAIISTRVREDAGDAFATYMIDNNGSYEGWSVGLDNRNNQRDFRITNNVFAVSNVATTAVFIDGSSRNIGIGTDQPRGALEVNGKLVIGNELYFGGVDSDEYGNTFMRERLYDPDGKSELVIVKANEGQLSGVAGPDRIRSIAPLHIFQTYDSTGLTTNETETLVTNEPGAGALLTINKDRVLVGTSEDPGGNSRLYINGGFAFASGSKIETGVMDIFSTTTAGGTGIIDNLSSNLVFRQSGDEYARFTNTSFIGIGTSTPSTNVHIYSPLTTSNDILKLESPSPALSLKHNGIVLNTDSGFGGYVRGYQQKSNGTAGLVLGSSNNNVLSNVLYITETSNVGIGTSTASSKLHVYNGITRFEHTTTNAMIELKTTAGISNILSDTNGNVYIQPNNSNTFIRGDLDISGDIRVEGRIDLGEEVGINLDGSEPQAPLHVGGGIITNSDAVSCKKYSNTFVVDIGTANQAKDVQLIFGPGAFYAKIVAMLRRIDNSTVNDMSTLVLEIQGGTGDGTDPDNTLTLGTKNMFSGVTNNYPWNPTVTLGKRGISIKPLVLDTQSETREYAYDIYVELMTACGGKLQKITRNLIDNADLDDGDGGGVTQKSFTY